MGLSIEENRVAADRTGAPADPIDRVHLARYTLGDLALEIEVLDLFLGQAPMTLASLSDAKSDKAWRDGAHTLKGSARAVGAFRVAAAAEWAERLGQRPNGVPRVEVLSALAEALDDVRHYIEGMKMRA